MQNFLSFCERSELQTTRRRRSPAGGSERRPGLSSQACRGDALVPQKSPSCEKNAGALARGAFLTPPSVTRLDLAWRPRRCESLNRHVSGRDFPWIHRLSRSCLRGEGHVRAAGKPGALVAFAYICRAAARNLPRYAKTGAFHRLTNPRVVNAACRDFPVSEGCYVRRLEEPRARS